jgi:hypothetical protein
VSAFAVNLVSLSALIDDINCSVTLDKFDVLIQERLMRQMVWTGTKRRGLWYMDKGVQPARVGVRCIHGRQGEAGNDPSL